MIQSNRHRGFTLVELLMVIVILGMLMALLLSAVHSARESGRRTQCLNKIRQIGVAMQEFESAHRKYPGWRHHPTEAIEASSAKRIVYSTSWFPQLMPHLGYAFLWDRTIPFTFGRPYRVGRDTYSNTPSLHTIAVCPSDAEKMQQRGALLSYAVNCGRKDYADPSPRSAKPLIAADWKANGMFHDYWDWRGNPNFSVHTVTMDASFIIGGDGLANTLMLAENRDAGLYYIRDNEWSSGFVFDPPTGPFKAINGPGFGGDYATARPSSNHLGGVNAAFASGAARFLRDDMDYLVYIALMTTKSAHAKEPGSTTDSDPQIRNGPKVSEDNL